MSDETDVAEDVVEEATEAKEQTTEASETPSSEDTKVLLSGDGDEGADDAVPEAYKYTPPEREYLGGCNEDGYRAWWRRPPAQFVRRKAGHRYLWNSRAGSFIRCPFGREPRRPWPWQSP